MPSLPNPRQTFAAILSMALLLAPALWNGFPLLQYDTGGYLARWYEGTLEESRSTVYGLPLALLAWPDFWPALIVQAGLTVWVLHLVLRAHGFGPLALVIVSAALMLLTSLPWIASILLTDIFAGLGVLALYLLLFADASLSRRERTGLVLLIAVSAATHSATLLVLAGLVIVAALSIPFLPSVVRAGVARGGAALVLSIVLLLAANAATAGRLAWTPGGLQILFGRMLQDGIVAQFLADRCPDPRFRLCEHRTELPRDADEFLWGQGLFDRLGRFDGLGDEMRTIALESLAAYPLWQAQAAVSAAARQLVSVASGEGVLSSLWHTYAIVEKFAPSSVPAMRAARQQRDLLRFDAINRVQVPVALISMALLLPLAVFGWRSARFAQPAQLAAIVAIALLGNAVVCGVLANPHDRYGARLAWLAVFAVLTAAAASASRRTVNRP
jgi:hypothetical protein